MCHDAAISAKFLEVAVYARHESGLSRDYATKLTRPVRDEGDWPEVTRHVFRSPGG